ncbi:lipid II flippase MurJ [Actinomycetospora sp. C-140]
MTVRPARARDGTPHRGRGEGGDDGTARGSLTTAGWTVVSRVTGLLRVVVVGAALGPTYFANLFQSANQVPNLTYEVVAGPVLALVVVPAAVRARTPDGAGGPRSRDLLGGVAGLLTVVSAAVAGLLVLVAPVAAWVLTAGVDLPGERGRAWLVTVVLIVLVAPQVVLYALAYLGAAAQQSRRRFALPAAAPAVENVVLMAVVGVVVLVHGAGVEIDTASPAVVLLLGGGSTLAVAIHAAIQVAGARAAGAPIRPRRGWRDDPEVMAVAVRLRRSVRVAALPAAGVFGLIAVAGTVPGGVSVFWLAYSLGAVPTALGARAVTAAVLPTLSAAAEARRDADFAAGWRRGLTYSSWVSVPAAALMVTFAATLAAILAVGELRSAAVVAALAVCIAVIGISQLFGSTYEIARQALFARLDTATAGRASDLGFVAVAVVAGASLLTSDAVVRLALLCGAVVARDVVASVVVLTRLRREIRPEPLVDGRAVGVVLVATAAMAPALWGGREVLATVPPGGFAAIAAVTVASVVAVGCFAGTARVATVIARTRRGAPC